MSGQPKALKWSLCLSTFFLTMTLAGCSRASTPEPTPKPEPTPTLTPSPIPTPTLESPPFFETAYCYNDELESLYGDNPAYDMECGYLVVAEDRQDPQGTLLRLPVVIFRTLNPDPESDAVVYLAGGGGYDYLSFLQRNIDIADAILENRDYILYNQRGAPGAEPSLSCPGYMRYQLKIYSDRDLSRAEMDARNIEFLLDCQDDLVARGIDLTKYNSAENAADANDLRIALGYEQANYYGTSYGTRIALTLMRDFPEGIRSVILDSVYPPQVGYYGEYATNTHRGFEKLFAACTADPDCNERYPNLKADFYQTADELYANPILRVYPGVGALILDGGFFIEGLSMYWYSPRNIRRIPRAITGAASGDYSDLDNFLPYILVPDYYNWATWQSIACREEVPFESYEDAFALSEGVPPQITAYYVDSFAKTEFALCESWRSGQADSIENEPVVSEIPTLILEGEFDPITPPEWGELTAEMLVNSFYYEFPGIGHGIMRNSGCGLQIGIDFLNDPTAAPSSNCIDLIPAPYFP